MAADLTGSGRYTLPLAAKLIPAGDYSAVDPTAVEFSTLGATALILTVVTTALTGAGNTVTFNVEYFDPASGTWIAIGTAVAIVSQATTKVVVDPRITAGANSYQFPVPGKVRVRPVGSGTRTTLNYTVGAQLCL